MCLFYAPLYLIMFLFYSTRMHRSSHDIDDVSLDAWAQHPWRGRCENFNYQLINLIAYPSSKPPGYDLKRSQRVLLNHLRSGHGRYASFMHRIGLRENANCICGAIQLNTYRIDVQQESEVISELLTKTFVTGLAITSYLNCNFYSVIRI